MKRACCAITLLLLFPSAVLFSQEWSTAQKEVLKAVEAYNAMADAGDVERFMGYFHKDYLGWDYRDALPRDKAALRKFADYDSKTTKTLVSDIKPAGIGVFGDFAFVHYYYRIIYKDVEGKEKSYNGRWTDILMKQGDNWVVIGDHGGEMPKD